MRLALFGGSGRTGGEVLRLAGERGWPVRTLVRPGSPCEVPPGSEALRGSLDSSSDVLVTLRDAEAVLCVFGPRTPRSAPFSAAATRTIIAAMEDLGIRRLLCQTGAMVGGLPSNVSLAMRTMAGLFARQCPDLAADAAEQEAAVMRSGLAWTLVKPPRLTDGRPTGRLRADAALRVGMMSSVRRADLAAFMLDEAVANRHLRRRVYVKG